MSARPSIACLVTVLAACSGHAGPDPDRDGGATRDAARDASGAGDAAADATADASRDAGPTLPPCRFDAVFVLEALDIATPRSERYVVPASARLDALGRSIDRAVDGDLVSAAEAADDAGYALCADGDVVIWRPTDATGQARIAWRRNNATRGLVFEAPHPFHDTGTLAQASALFERIGARVLIASGTHRCANTAAGCTGSSTACGEPSGYRESDAAHFAVATFQRAHEGFAARFADDVVISVHGFAQDGASLSDGTTAAVAEDAPAARLARALVAVGIEGVTSCNPGAGVDVAERLCGTTNVQGRHLNGSPDACNARPPGASGRFVHLEQSRAVRSSLELVTRAFELAF